MYDGHPNNPNLQKHFNQIERDLDNFGEENSDDDFDSDDEDE